MALLKPNDLSPPHLYTVRSYINYTKICCHNFCARSNNLVKYVSKVAPIPQPPDGIPLVRSCLEILPVITESHSDAERPQCCLWFHGSQWPHFSSVRIQDQVSQNMDRYFISPPPPPRQDVGIPELPSLCYFLPQLRGGCLDWTWWIDSLVTAIA